MSDEGAQPIVAICNPAAGGVGNGAFTAALDVLRSGAEVAVVTLDHPSQLGEVMSRYGGHKPVVIGGDGSLHTVIQFLYHRRLLDTVTLGLIPMGTGNDFARGVGIPLDPVRAAEVVLRGQERRLDLLVDDTGGVVVNALHLGVGAQGSREAAPLKPRLGRFAYPIGAVIAAFRAQGWLVKVTVDGAVVADGRRRILMIGVGNGTSIGGGTPLSPHAVPDDGLVDVMVSFAVGRIARVVYGILLKLGRHISYSQVVTRRGRTVTVSGEAVPLNTDGELTDGVQKRTWRVRPGAWRLTVPRI